MAITNRDRVSKGMDLLQGGLRPYVERELKSKYGERWPQEVKVALGDRLVGAAKKDPLQDVAIVLTLMDKVWGQVFGVTLGKADRTLVHELAETRNRWAHTEPFTGDDTYRALDSIGRLLTSVGAHEASEIDKMKADLRRLQDSEQVRGETRRAGGSLVEVAATEGLTPWRDIISPHPDVASGRFQQAEFAADLWQVHVKEATPEYQEPKEFFRRTFLTESLKQLLVNGVQRLAGKGGDPVVQLQTNFGGGKTHSMLALYHLFSGAKPADLPGVDGVMAAAGISELPKIRRVVLVGNKISPGNPSKKEDGTVVRTLWGELAWQLGGKKAFAKIAADDDKATSPGDVLRTLFDEYGPCLILIDEWVAYARQLHEQKDLPGGDFETQFSFAQALTESAKGAKRCLLLVSLPASDTAGSPHAQANDVEVGGVRGRDALDRLRNVVGRLESSWRPATAEEGFEIVRRRLFEPIAGAEAFKRQAIVVRAFSELYRTQATEFPAETRTADYEKRMIASYPIHPEIFDRLYNDWSTLVKFQRTRGVLRLMAAVIHSLWEKGDHSPLILPSLIPIDDQRVQFELTRYLSDSWTPILEKDVDGPHSLPLKIDREITNLGKIHATRRVARTIYLGSAPLVGSAHAGLEDSGVKLGCVIPGESPQIFGDALRRLAGAATYLYQEGGRSYYSTLPTVTKLAEEKAEQFGRDVGAVAGALSELLDEALRDRGDFAKIHALPHSGAEVQDDRDTRLVVLGTDHPYSKEAGNPAEVFAGEVLRTRGSGPRLYQNSLVLLAPDKVRLQDLVIALCKRMAWKSIVDDRLAHNLTPGQVKQAEEQLKKARTAAEAQVAEVFQWVLVPEQTSATSPIGWKILKSTGAEPLAVRVSKKLKNEDLLNVRLGPVMLRMAMDKVPLWRGDHIAVQDLLDFFPRYPYLNRLSRNAVLLESIRDGINLVAWNPETFAFAERFDEQKQRYVGLRAGELVALSDGGDSGILVKPEVAARQMAQDAAVAAGRPVAGITDATAGSASSGPAVGARDAQAQGQTRAKRPKRFHGTVALEALRAGRDVGEIAAEVLSHLTGLPGAKVKVTLEVEAEIPEGAPENVVRTVTENARTLKFTNQGFEAE